MDVHQPAGGAAVPRRHLEAVIRRAAELYAAEADTGETLSEAELLQIARELGLPARHVRQALYELPLHREAGSVLDWLFGPAWIGAVRAVAGDPDALLARLEHYLSAREYLRPVRRRAGYAWFEPADDAISNIARAFSRPASRHHLARARQVALAVRALDPGSAHVGLQLDLGHRRRKAVAGATVAGGILGAGLGAGAVALLGESLLPVLGAPAAVGAAAMGGLTVFSATLAGSLTVARSRFRRAARAARLELAGLLDRLESGERLEPPPAPWRRRLQPGRDHG